MEGKGIIPYKRGKADTYDERSITDVDHTNYFVRQKKVSASQKRDYALKFVEEWNRIHGRVANHH